MTDTDNLRDRIAAIVEAYLPREHMGYGSGEYAAQAIIDDLGLRAEGQMGAYGDDPVWEERVVGKWEAEQ